MHHETYTKKLEHHAWEGRLVGYSMDSKSYRVHNAETTRVRDSRNVIFIETPSVMCPPDVGGYDDGEFTYDGHDDMVRDLRNYTFNHSIDSLSPDHAVGDPPLIDLLERLRETTDRDLGFSPAGSSPPADGAHRPSGDAPGVDNPASPGGVSPPAPGEGCLLYTSPSPRDRTRSRMPSSA